LVLLVLSLSHPVLPSPDPAPPPIHTLSLHDALPISPASTATWAPEPASTPAASVAARTPSPHPSRTAAGCPTATRSPSGSVRTRSEEHTSELQSRENLVCRLLLEKKNKNTDHSHQMQ